MTNNQLHSRLFEGLKNGDKDSIEMIYQTIFPKVLSWLLGNSGNRDDAYDLFQDCLETILLKIDHIDRSLEGLIMQMAKYKWIDRIRKNKTQEKVRNELVNRHKAEITDYPFVTEEEEYLKHKVIERAFEQLSGLCRKILTMIKAGQEVHSIVAALSLSSPNTLYRRKAACVERWSTLIKNDPNYNLIT